MVVLVGGGRGVSLVGRGRGVGGVGRVGRLGRPLHEDVGGGGGVGVGEVGVVRRRRVGVARPPLVGLQVISISLSSCKSERKGVPGCRHRGHCRKGGRGPRRAEARRRRRRGWAGRRRTRPRPGSPGPGPAPPAPLSSPHSPGPTFSTSSSASLHLTCIANYMDCTNSTRLRERTCCERGCGISGEEADGVESFTLPNVTGFRKGWPGRGCAWFVGGAELMVRKNWGSPTSLWTGNTLVSGGGGRRVEKGEGRGLKRGASPYATPPIPSMQVSLIPCN